MRIFFRLMAAIAVCFSAAAAQNSNIANNNHRGNVSARVALPDGPQIFINDTNTAIILVPVDNVNSSINRSEGGVGTGVQDNGTTIGPQSEQPAIGPQSEQPAIGPQSEQPAIGPQSQQPAIGPQSQQPAIGPQSEQPAIGPQSEEPTVIGPRGPTLMNPNPMLGPPAMDNRGVVPQNGIGPASQQPGTSIGQPGVATSIGRQDIGVGARQARPVLPPQTGRGVMRRTPQSAGAVRGGASGGQR